ncbi:MAG: hypothetical protein R6X22_10355 [Gemmatimonadota bacterium]
MRRVITLVAVLVAAAFLVPQTAQAQTYGTDAEAPGCCSCVQFACGYAGHRCNPGGGRWASPHDFCMYASTVCDGYHPTCEGSATAPDEIRRLEDMQDFLEQAIDGDVDAVFTLVDSYPDQVAVHLNRGALQIEGVACLEGRVIAHLPLTDAQVNAILVHQPGITVLASR